MSERSSWTTTTHEWVSYVDPEHLADVRRRLGQPGAAGGRRHLILEVLAYANDEAHSQSRTGHATVILHADGHVTIDDDGRGTDTRRDSDGRIVRKPIMATADIRFADPAASPRLPDALPRRGMSTVAALSSELTHDNHRNDGSWSQTYRHGIPGDELTPLEPRERSGTSVTFQTDIIGPSAPTDQDLLAFPSLRVDLI